MSNDSSTATFRRMELDSHADTIVLGSNAIIMQYMSRECDVSPYADSYEPIRNVPIVTGATAVTSQITGETLILFFNEIIWMGAQLDHSLINPNQLRHHGIIVQDNPYADTSMHLASHNNEFIMPMQAEGTTIFFDSRTQTNYKLANCPHIILSSNAPWNPREVQFPTPTHHVEEGYPMHEIGDVHTFNLLDMAHGQVPIAKLIVNRVRVIGDPNPDVPLTKNFRFRQATLRNLSSRTK